MSCSRSRTCASPTIPRARLGEQMEAALYLNHPYGRPVIGWRHEIEKLDREDALDFYKRFYTPNNAILVVAGDVTPEQVSKLAEETYGKDSARRRGQAAHATAGAGAAGAAHGDAGRSARHPAERHPLLSRALEHDRPAGRKRSARRARAHPGPRLEQPALSRRWWSARASRSAPARATTAPRSTPRASASTRRRKPGTSLPQLEEAIDAVLAEVIEHGVTARGARALQEPHDRRRRSMRSDNQRTHGAAGTARRWRPARPSSRSAPGPTASARSPPKRCATPRDAGSTSAVRSPAIWSRTRRPEEKRS